MSHQFIKNQDIALTDLGGTSPVLVFALSWSKKPKAGILNMLTNKHHEADLDLSCVLYDDNNDRIDCVWYAQLTSKCGSIRHRGDDTAGWHDGDDETVTIDMNQLPENATTLFFTISSFNGDSFSQAENAYWRIFDAHDKRELGSFNISPNDKTSAKIVLRMQKVIQNGLAEWHLKALDEYATGQNIQEIFPEIRSLIED